jgi:hypothetical protein
MKPWLSDPEEERKEKWKKEAYEKHPCRNCVWGTWQKEVVVMCLLLRCVKEKSEKAGLSVDKLW